MATTVNGKGTPLPMGYGRDPGPAGFFPTSLILPTFIFDGVPSPIQFDITEEILSGNFDFVQAMYIDNRNNGSVSLNVLGFAGPIVLKSYSQGWFSIACPPLPQFTLNHTIAGASVNIAFANRAIGAGVWQTQ